ncbi:MAG: type IX secretion system protein PorQ [Bacteroidales bacterium]|nr:type IX secretion system protein PorQ [Bacteroidales bacterium]
MTIQAFNKVMRRGVAIIGIILLWPVILMAQKGGEYTYSFLGLTNSARVAALGGEVVSILDDDMNLVFHNPSLLSSGMHNHLNLNYVNYFAGVNFGYASYGYTLEGIGNFAAGMHYVDYGTFDRTDELGQSMGTFRASEYALNLVYSRSIIDTFLTAGVNLKPIFSSFEQYSSLGIALDAGITYHNPKTLTTIGLVAKNLGTQIISYTGTREKLPFEIQAGITQGLAHAPFRFSVTFQHLERWDLTYEKMDSGDFNSLNDDVKTSGFDLFGDKLMRHMVFGVEFLMGQNFHFDLGYNYKRRQEMKVNARPGMVGFSWGFGFRISKFHFAFGRASYHLVGGTNHFSLTTNLSEFYRKQQ